MSTEPIERKRWSTERGQITAKLWLFLLEAGGRWSSWDIATALGEKSNVVGWTLAAMVRNDNARQFPVEGKTRRFTYGVTGACRIPRSVNVNQVAQSVLAKAPDAEVVA